MSMLNLNKLGRQKQKQVAKITKMKKLLRVQL